MANLGFILVAAVLTYGTRVAGFAFGGREVPPVARRFLDYVPIAVFAALIAPEAGIGGAQWAARLLGIAAAALAVWRTRQLWAALVAGLATYWIVRALGG